MVPSPLPHHQLAVLAVVRILDGYAATRGGIVDRRPARHRVRRVRRSCSRTSCSSGPSVDVTWSTPPRCTRHAPDIVVEEALADPPRPLVTVTGLGR